MLFINVGPVLNMVAAYVNITSNVSATIAVSWQVSMI